MLLSGTLPAAAASDEFEQGIKPWKDEAPVVRTGVPDVPPEPRRSRTMRGIHLPAGSAHRPWRGPAVAARPRPPEPGFTALRFERVDDPLDPALPSGLYFGATWADLDADGDLDLTIPVDADTIGLLRVWRNEDGRFVEITGTLGLPPIDRARTAAWVDLDGDGDLDLYVTRRFRADPNRLFENRGGRLIERPESELDREATDVSQAWADWDGDGDLDLFLPNTVEARVTLYRNDGDFRFTDVTEAAGIDPALLAFGGAWADWDEDGDPDLAIAGAFTMRLLRNVDGVFADVTGELGVLTEGLLVTPTWGDADNDGDLDLLVGGLFPPRLFENRLEEGGGFRDRTETWGSGFVLGTGGVWVDLDLDGDVDLLDEGGNGAVRIYENRIAEGRGLVDVTREAGIDPVLGISWHPVPGDLDGDGLVDFFEPQEKEPTIYRNRSTPAGRALRLRLIPEGGGLPIGARVRYEGERLQVREIAWPEAAFSFASTQVVFALGQRGAASAIEVSWASGARERFAGLRAGTLHTLREGEGLPVRERRGGRRALAGAQVTGLGPLAFASSCNPCRGSVELRFTGRGADQVTAPGVELEVYDLRGRRVRRLLARGAATAWDLRDDAGRRVPAGLYFVRPAPEAAGPAAALTPIRVVVLP